MAYIYKNNVRYGTTDSSQIYYSNGNTVKQELDLLLQARAGVNRNILFKEKKVATFTESGGKADILAFFNKYDIKNGNFYGLELGNYIEMSNFKIKDKNDEEITFSNTMQFVIVGFDSYYGRLGSTPTQQRPETEVRINWHHLVLMPRLGAMDGVDHWYTQIYRNSGQTASGLDNSLLYRDSTKNILRNFNDALHARLDFNTYMDYESNFILQYATCHSTSADFTHNGATASVFTIAESDVRDKRCISEIPSIVQVTGTNLTGNIFDASIDCEQLPIYALTSRSNLGLGNSYTGFWCREMRSFTAFSTNGGEGDPGYRDANDTNPSTGAARGYPIRPIFLLYDPRFL